MWADFGDANSDKDNNKSGQGSDAEDDWADFAAAEALPPTIAAEPEETKKDVEEYNFSKQDLLKDSDEEDDADDFTNFS